MDLRYFEVSLPSADRYFWAAPADWDKDTVYNFVWKNMGFEPIMVKELQKDQILPDRYLEHYHEGERITLEQAQKLLEG